MISAIATRVMPVLRLGVIQAELESFQVTGFSEFGDKIALARTTFYAVEIRNLGVKKRETVMMLDGKANVFHTPLFGLFGDSARVKMLGIKSLCQQRVFIRGDAQVILNPLRQARRYPPLPFTTEQRVQAEMNEQSIFSVSKTLQGFQSLHRYS